MKHHQLKYSGEFYSTETAFHEQIQMILELNNSSEIILKKSRNTLKVIDYHGRKCVVKAFRIPSFPQNYSYGLLADSKAKKSYDNAKRLLSLNIKTPRPVGYYEHRSKGKLLTSYYICEYTSDINTLYELFTDDRNLNSELIKEFADYSYTLHANGILHRDFNPKNILVSQTTKSTEFSLVDINRITWYKKLSLSKAIESLSRLSFGDSSKSILIEAYAKAANVDTLSCKKLLEKSENKTNRYFRNKSRLRKIFPKK